MEEAPISQERRDIDPISKEGILKVCEEIKNKLDSFQNLDERGHYGTARRDLEEIKSILARYDAMLKG